MVLKGYDTLESGNNLACYEMPPGSNFKEVKMENMLYMKILLLLSFRGIIS